MEKYKPKRLVFFFSLIYNYSCFHLNIKNRKGTEAYSYDNCSSGLRNHLLPPSPPHLFFTWLPWGSDRVLLKPPWIYSFLVFMLGSSWSWQESRTLGAGGRSQQKFSGMWDRWKDKHPWNTRRLEAYMCWCIHIYVVWVVVCVCISLWAIYTIQVSCNVCVSMAVCVQ